MDSNEQASAQATGFTESDSGVNSYKLLECDVEVLTFVVDQAAYYFIATDGRRADIIRCRTLQPNIDDPDDYFYYMWVQATQGYFVLKQRFVEGQPRNWQLIGEMTTEKDGPDVFDEWSDELKERYSK
jgi:hypothetical protein